jgi:hypothetical protein
VIRLATRLTAGGGRESLIRLLLTGAGMALAVTMLLFAAVAFPALHAHDVRRAWLSTHPAGENQQPAQNESTTDPLLWLQTIDRFDGQDIQRVDVAALGPDAPVPPGLDELPGPGEVAMSPKLQELLDTTDPAMLAGRFPGEVTATIGKAALASPDDLVAIVGRAPSELSDNEDTLTVRSIETAPISHALTREMRVVFVVGGIGLLLPVIVFVATATRLAAARREQRLAAMRLAGATHEQVGFIAAVEAAIAAIGGTVVGLGAFLAMRPSLARIPFDGATFYPSDLHLSLVWAAIIAVGVPALAIGAAIVSLRRIRISPLGVAQRATPSRPTPRPLLLVAVGMLALALVVVWAGRANDVADTTIAYAVGVPFVVMIVGIVLSGPWLTTVVARGIARFGRRAPSLMAARRLQDNPSAGFRAISGLTLAVFVGTVFSGLSSSIIANQHFQGSGLSPDVVAAAPSPKFPHMSSAAEPQGPVKVTPADLPQFPTLDPARTTQLVQDLGAIPGVEHVISAHAFPDDPDLLEAVIRSGAEVGASVLVSCDDAAALGFDGCEGTTVLNIGPGGVEPTGFATSMSASELADLRVVAVAAVTDGSLGTMERARTELELGIPGTTAMTLRDIDSETRAEFTTMQRISNIGLTVTLVIAGCSLAVAVAGAIVERKQSFALLRLAGTRISDLRQVVLAEAAGPLLMVAAASVGLGLLVAYLVLAAGAAGGGSPHFVMPRFGFWLSLVGGLGVALLVVLATLPLLNRLTALDSARFE